MKGTHLAVLKPDQSLGSLKQDVKVNTTKKIKTAQRTRKSLECRQLEKLRNMKFGEDQETLNIHRNKAAFLKALNLEPQAIYL